MDSTRLPPSNAAQRVALRAALAAFCAGALATVEALVSPEVETGRFAIAAYWAVFGASLPIFTRAVSRIPGPARLLLAIGVGAYVAPMLCIAAAVWLGVHMSAVPGETTAWAAALQEVRNFSSSAYGLFLLGRPLPFVALFLLGTGLTPKVHVAVLALVSFVLQVIGCFLFHRLLFRGIGMPDIHWSDTIWPGLQTAAAVVGVGAGEWIEQRHALWRVAAKDLVARTGV